VRALLVSFAALLALPAAAVAAAEMYSYTQQTRSFSYIKSVCGARGDAYTVTEVVTQEIFNTRSGVSYVGTGGLPRGSSWGTGRIRRAYSKVVEGPDPAPPEDYTITETTSLIPTDWGQVEKAGKTRRRISVVALNEDLGFGRLRKGQSITLTVNEPEKTEQTDDGRCVTTSRGSTTGTVTIRRVR